MSQIEERVPRARTHSTAFASPAANVSDQARVPRPRRLRLIAPMPGEPGMDMAPARPTTVVAAVVNAQIEEAGMEMSQMRSTTVVAAEVNAQIEEAGMEMSQVLEVRESLTLTRCTALYVPVVANVSDGVGNANVAAISMGVAPVSQIMDAAPVPAQARETRSELWVLLVMFVAIFVVAMMCVFDTPPVCAPPPVCAAPPVCAEYPVVNDWVMIKCFAGEWAKNSRDEWVRILIKEDF